MMDIFDACRLGDLEYVKRWIKGTGDIELRDSLWWQTPLSCASKCGHVEIVRFLAKHGANIESRSKDGKTPIMWATWNNRIEVVRLLVEIGADLDVKDSEGMTMLMLASYIGYEKIVRMLVGLGAKLDAVNEKGRTAIALASKSVHANVVRILAELGSDVDSRDNDGNTPIILASESQQGVVVVRTLVELGANILVRNKYGKNAVDVALVDGSSSTVLFLASMMISKRTSPYSDIPMSAFIPRCEKMMHVEYTDLVREIIPAYIDRAIEDPAFGVAMQRDVEEIVNGKTTWIRHLLTKKDVAFLTKLLKTLRSIDYTDHISNPEQKDCGKMSSIYDMEL